MSGQSHHFEVGQCIRLRRYEWQKTVIGGNGKTLRQEVHEYMVGLYQAWGIPCNNDPNAPSYIYLKLTKVTENELIGVDILTLRELQVEPVEYMDYKWQSGNTKFDEIAVLSHRDACDIIKRHQTELDGVASRAQTQAQTYRAQTAAILCSL